MIILNSPSNPTGGVMPLAALEHIAQVAIERDIWVLSDEIYMRLAFDGCEVPTIAALPGMQERTIICDGFSKTYAMTGWRLGYGIMPEALAERVELLLTHSVGCTASFTQVAGIEALTGPQEEVDAVVAEYQRRRDVLVAGLNKIPGWRCRSPQGAFYVFPNVVVVRQDLRPGGPISCWSRPASRSCPALRSGPTAKATSACASANSMDNIREAIDRIADAVARI